ncbi:MAG: tetratricopeptide repeat protein, partial [Bacteriovoracaceae bacterium]|nr:tetratricopeptide repeat protein [Bacteriovoracaceae bacterium]
MKIWAWLALIFKMRKWNLAQSGSMLLLGLGLLSGGAYGQNASPESLFAAANKSFHQGAWDEALQQYAAIKPARFEVWYNMGSTYFKKGELGKALYYFKKAVQERPRDADARFNLKYVQSKLDAVALPKAWYEYVALPLNATEGWWFLGIGLMIIAAGVSFGRRWPLWLLLVIVPLGAASVAQTLDFKKFAVAAEEVKVYSSPSAEGILLFTLPAGSELKLVQAQEGNAWAVVQVDATKKGWALAKNLMAAPFLGH